MMSGVAYARTVERLRKIHHRAQRLRTVIASLEGAGRNTEAAGAAGGTEQEKRRSRAVLPAGLRAADVQAYRVRVGMS
ncbi:unnamed protein product [Amoebophrya sp. A120]|nr:unnamed protein product [Amoebophrya sp. A120]|eukprot:GSA120T00025692001.1